MPMALSAAPGAVAALALTLAGEPAPTSGSSPAVETPAATAADPARAAPWSWIKAKAAK